MPVSEVKSARLTEKLVELVKVVCDTSVLLPLHLHRKAQWAQVGLGLRHQAQGFAIK